MHPRWISGGMGDMMEMGQPDNSISMRGGDGPFGMIDMGRMFTVLEVREKLTGEADLARDGIKENP